MTPARLLPLALALANPWLACGDDGPPSNPADADSGAEPDADARGDTADEDDAGADGETDATCPDPTCAGHGICLEADGGAACACDTGHAGDDCSRCAVGYQDHDGDGRCRPDCATAGLDCGPHGLCTDAAGTAACRCENGWQDNDEDGTCHPACATAPLDCGERRRCDDATGLAVCNCDWGRLGDDCASCAPGFEPDGDHCAPDHEWAFLVYLAADNALEGFARADLEELAQAGSSDELHVVALFDPFVGDTRFLYVEPGAATVVSEAPELDTGDYRTLRDFGAWASRTYPARHTALVVWNHGNGWKSGSGTMTPRSVALDEHGSSFGISLAAGDLGRALEGIVTARGGRRLDLVGFDACRMGMWETAVAVEPWADLLVASSEDEPPDGWPYLPPLRALRAAPATTPRQLATALVEAYAAESTRHFTLAATDLGLLAGAVDDWARALLAHPEALVRLEAARAVAQGFADPDYRDLWDVARRVAESDGVPRDVSEASARLLRELATSSVASRHQPSHPGAHGLSIYLPGLGAGMNPAYASRSAPWSATGWDDLLAAFTAE